MKFESGQQMLDYINEGNDLYSKSAEIYVFCYNDAGSVATYDISAEKANELTRLVKESKTEEYWSSFLGVGGNIWDDPSHELYKDCQQTNLDCCNQLVQYTDWVRTNEYGGNAA